MKKLSILIIIWLMLSVILYASDKAALRTQIRYLLNDTNSQRWSDSVLDARMELAQPDIVRKTKCLQGTTTYTVYQSTKEYTLPLDCLFVERVSFQYVVSSTGSYEKIPRWTILGLDSDLANWQATAAGKPLKYYLWGDKLNIVPGASAAYAGASKLQIHYIVNPSSMSAETSIPFNGQTQLYPYHELIIWRVCMMCKLDERAYAEAQVYENKYDKRIGEMIKEINTKGDDWDPNFKMRR